MAITWSIVPDSNLGRIVLNVSGLVASGHTYTLKRQAPSGRYSNVRNAEPIPAGLTAYVVNDWEAPPDTSVYYAIDDTLNSSGAVTTEQAPGGPWQWKLAFPYNCRVLHPTVPALSVRSIVNTLSELTRDVRTETHYPLGRADPVVVAQVRQLPTGSVALLCLNQTDADKLVTLLTQASVFCLQTSAGHRLAEGELWLAAGSLVETRSGSPEALTGPRMFALDYSQVGRPPGTVSSAVSAWSEVPQRWATWAATVSNNPSWNALLFGIEVDPAIALGMSL